MDASRRGFLASVAAGGGWFAGCRAIAGSQDEPVRVLTAGSLQTPFVEGLRAAVSTPITVEAHGSAAVARLVAHGKRDPDVLALADTALFADPIDDAWYARFATNDLVVATADTDGGRRVATAERWFDPLLAGEARFGRTDPELDPLGYRTLFVLRLGAAHYDRPGLARDLLAPDQVYPETSLMASLETGAVDAAVVYGSMATQHEVTAIDLPAPVDLGSPDHASSYSDVTYDLPGGPTVAGGLIEYGVTLRTKTARAKRVFEALVAGEYLPAFGFDVPAGYPRYTEDAPSLA